MQHLTREELKSLLREVPKPWQRLMILTAFWHGLRCTEVTGITGSDIKDGYVNVRRLKGSEHTIQAYISHTDPELDESAGLKELSKTLGPNDRVFPMTRFGFYKLMKRAGTRAGIPEHKLHPHVLKHSIAMQSVRKMGVEKLRTHLGHKSLSSTGFYLRITQEEATQALQEAMA